MKRLIFKSSIFLFSALTFSCGKKQFAFQDPGQIEWHSNAERDIHSSTTFSDSEKDQFTPPVKDASQQIPSRILIKKEYSDIINIPKYQEPVSVLKKHEFNTRKAEKRAYRKQLRESLKSTDPDTNKLLLVLIAILLPPVAVGLVRGWASGAFILNLILTLLFWFPGVIHALIVVLVSE
jgi:uncharacterized membrane protein YqaE (UPF0057 family)